MVILNEEQVGLVLQKLEAEGMDYEPLQEELADHICCAIEREMNRSLQEEFNIEQVENQGRYYMARNVRPDGTTLQRLLVDKQTGTVRLVGK